ncbi:MAG: glycosyltransferase family 1 protein [Verrucomicrobiota bacterium]
MIRVALSTSVVQRGKSGVASYIFGLLDGMRRIDAPVKLVLFGLADDKPLFEKWLDRCQWVPVEERYRPAVKNILWHQTSLRGVLRREKIDVLHIPSYRRIVASPPVPQVVTIHDLAAFAVRGKYDLARMIYGKYVVRGLARQAKIVSTVSHATARDVQQYFGLPEAAIHVIWNGISHDTFRPQPPEKIQAAMARLGQHSPYFIYLARLEHPGKNHVRLIEAFEQFCQQHPGKPHELVFGGADWHGAEAIHQRIAVSPFKERIRSLGFVAKDDLPLWYGGATAMIYPSLFEGFGLPPIEAMACGVPVISSTCGSLGEVVGEAARLIDPHDPQSMAEAMAEIASNPEIAASRSRLGLERAALFSWERAATAMCDLYKQAALT